MFCLFILPTLWGHLSWRGVLVVPGSFDVRAYPRTLAEALEKLGGATMDPTGTDQAADGLRAGAASHDAYEAVTSGVENVISVTGKPGEDGHHVGGREREGEGGRDI
jgi:hypothetical protein